MNRRRSLKRICTTVVVAAIALLAMPAARAEAGTFALSLQGTIPDAAHVDWASYGADFTTVSNGTVRALPGLPSINLTISEQTGFDFLRVTQGAFASWEGNFADGDAVLYTANGGPIDFIFSSPVAGFGDQIQWATFGAFTARIEAFNSANVSLGAFTLNGNSTDANDDSAIFLGLRSEAVDISRVRLSLTSAQPGDFGINNPVITMTPVPEPMSLVLLGTGLVAIVRRQITKA
jgi:hypothetical protein